MACHNKHFVHNRRLGFEEQFWKKCPLLKDHFWCASRRSKREELTVALTVALTVEVLSIRSAKQNKIKYWPAPRLHPTPCSATAGTLLWGKVQGELSSTADRCVAQPRCAWDTRLTEYRLSCKLRIAAATTEWYNPMFTASRSIGNPQKNSKAQPRRFCPAELFYY